MKEKSISREELLESFGTLATLFTSSLAEAQALEQSFEASRARLVQTISGHLRSAQKSLAASNPLQDALITFVDAMAETSKQWDAAVAGREKGVKFREGFEDSLLVFVGGKVKSGKSSLGNYMAWGHTDPADQVKRQTPPERFPKYQSHEQTQVVGGDSHNEAVKRGEFRVGATEATSSIQSFGLPGLTWVDSPGLHSLKEENGKLALEYGPCIYCLEEKDNGDHLSGIYVRTDTGIRKAPFPPQLMGQLPALEYEGERLSNRLSDEGRLYGSPRFVRQSVQLYAVPYGMWGNRGEGEMLVWQNAVIS